MQCFIPNTSESSLYHAIDPFSRIMSRMGMTPAIALLVLAVAVLAASPHASASVTVRDLGTLPGYTSSEALGINAAGQVVGTSSDMQSQSRPFLWDDGVMTNLGTLGGSRGTAHGISDTGLIVGESEDSTHTMHAFLWENGAMTDLGAGVAFAVNDQGQAVGCGYPTSPAPPCHAVLWQAGRVTDLGTLGGRSGSAYGINNAGQVIGSSFAPDGFMHAFLWQDGTMTDLGGLPGYQFSVAWDVNDVGQVVGSSDGQDGTTHAVLWEHGGVRDLGNLGGRGATAFGINDAGQVVGISFSDDGRMRRCRLRAGRSDLRVLSSAPEPSTAQESEPEVNVKPDPPGKPGRATFGIRAVHMKGPQTTPDRSPVARHRTLRDSTSPRLGRRGGMSPLPARPR